MQKIRWKTASYIAPTNQKSKWMDEAKTKEILTISNSPFDGIEVKEMFFFFVNQISNISEHSHTMLLCLKRTGFFFLHFKRFDSKTRSVLKHSSKYKTQREPKSQKVYSGLCLYVESLILLWTQSIWYCYCWCCRLVAYRNVYLCICVGGGLTVRCLAILFWFIAMFSTIHIECINIYCVILCD